IVEVDEVVDLRLHAPRTLAGVAVKLWDGESLLAQWDGDIEPGGGASPNDRDYCKLTVKTTKTSSDDPDVFAIRVRLPGVAAPVAIPLASEKQERDARPVPLGLSIEKDGAEKFRSASPCIVQMPTTLLSFEHHTYAVRKKDRSFDDDGKEVEALTHRWVCLGLKSGEGMKARLEIVGAGRINGRGIAVDVETGQPIYVRKGRKLWAYFHDEKADLAKGVSEIPIAACDEVQADGVVQAHRPALANLLSVNIAEVKVEY